MAERGCTSGGAPIYFGQGPRRPKSNGNTRHRCKSCGHRTTKNQMKANGGVCFNCRIPLQSKEAGSAAEQPAAKDAPDV